MANLARASFCPILPTWAITFSNRSWTPCAIATLTKMMMMLLPQIKAKIYLKNADFLLHVMFVNFLSRVMDQPCRTHRHCHVLQSRAYEQAQHSPPRRPDDQFKVRLKWTPTKLPVDNKLYLYILGWPVLFPWNCCKTDEGKGTIFKIPAFIHVLMPDDKTNWRNN